MRIAGEITLCTLLAAALLLAGCGGTSGAPALATPVAGQTPEPAISPDVLPAASVGVEYSARFVLQGAGGAPATWSVVDGSLPDGLVLGADGALGGEPQVEGMYVFRVAAEADGLRVVGEFPLAVDALGLHVTSGLVAGEAWAGRAVSISAVGAESTVVFSLEGGSGGEVEVSEGDPAKATVLPAPLPEGDSAVSLRVVAEEVGTGRRASLDLVVRPDPTAAFRGGFGWSDVWHLDVSARTGDHAYATDFQAALARLGFRAPESTDLEGTHADRLAEIYVRLQTLRAIHRHFGWGEPGGEPLAITLAFDRPTGEYVAPPPGARLMGAPNRFSVVRLEWATERGVFATGLLDTPWNVAHEHDASANGEEHGVFLQVVVDRLERSYGLAALRSDPIGPDDVAGLRALLLGLPAPDSRTERIAAYAEAIGRALGRVCAHEIGHGLGLGHADEGTHGALMSTAIGLAPWEEWTFTEGEWTQLAHTSLPGRGRVGAAPLSLAKPEAEPAGACGCALHAD